MCFSPPFVMQLSVGFSVSVVTAGAQQLLRVFSHLCRLVHLNQTLVRIPP